MDVQSYGMDAQRLPAEIETTLYRVMQEALTNVFRHAKARRVGILDLDYHYGDGTADIIMRLQPNWLFHYSAGEHWRRPEQAEAFLAALPGIVSSCIADCDVLIYQAGADPLLGDPLGGFLTAAQLRERDRIVFQTANSRAVPVAWDLAGGYSRDSAQTISPVLGVHRNTAIESLAAACPDALSS